MSANDDQYMYEINRLEGERDFWKRRSVQFERAVKLVWKRLPENDRRELSEVCRNTGGPCFCGAHTGTEAMMEGSQP